jgi:hypothetical protein
VEVPYATITISIPAEKLDEALAKIKAMVADPKKDILSEKMSSQNVTKEYVDLDSRLKNLEKADERLTSIMAQAVKTEDVLAVYNQLTQVEEQMEVIKGQMKYYEQSAANSTLTINLQAQETIKPVTVAGWEPTGVARDAVQALLNTLKVIANIAIWLIIYILPLGVILALIILFIRWLWPKVFKPRKRAMPPLPPMMPPAPPAA